MAIFLESNLTEITLGVFTLLCVICWYLLNHVFSHWKLRGIPYVRPHLLFGNYKDLVFATRSVYNVQQDIYNNLKGKRFGGFFQFFKPSLMIRDPELIDQIIIKDFSHFMDRGFGKVDPKHEPMSTALFVMQGQKWRHLRYKLTPTFTSGKLKGMFEQICTSGEYLSKDLNTLSKKAECFQPKTVLDLFTTDVIATCAFGLQFNRDSYEGKLFQDMAVKGFKPSRLQMMRFFFMMTGSVLAKLLKLPMFPKDVTDYFIEITKATIRYRENNNNIKRNDFLQLLLTLREQEKSGKIVDLNEELKEEDSHLIQADYKPSSDPEPLELTDEMIAAQSITFLSAGSDTISNSIALVLYCIAANPQVQEAAQKEVDSVLAMHGGWSYAAVQGMTYLDQVIQEGLRMFPVTPTLQRLCTVPYKIPGTDIVLKKGDLIVIPVFSLHMDPHFYPDPETFNPERFEGNNYRPSNKYLPFGNGPRMCIAMRFAILEMKVCLAKILSQFTITVNSKTQQPLQFEPISFASVPKGGLWFDVKERALSIS